VSKKVKRRAPRKMPARRESKPDDHRELVRGIEALHALMGDLDAYLNMIALVDGQG